MLRRRLAASTLQDLLFIKRAASFQREPCKQQDTEANKCHSLRSTVSISHQRFARGAYSVDRKHQLGPADTRKGGKNDPKYGSCFRSGSAGFVIRSGFGSHTRGKPGHVLDQADTGKGVRSLATRGRTPDHLQDRAFGRGASARSEREHSGDEVHLPALAHERAEQREEAVGDQRRSRVGQVESKRLVPLGGRVFTVRVGGDGGRVLSIWRK